MEPVTAVCTTLGNVDYCDEDSYVIGLRELVVALLSCHLACLASRPQREHKGYMRVKYLLAEVKKELQKAETMKPLGAIAAAAIMRFAFPERTSLRVSKLWWTTSSMVGVSTHCQNLGMVVVDSVARRTQTLLLQFEVRSDGDDGDDEGPEPVGFYDICEVYYDAPLHPSGSNMKANSYDVLTKVREQWGTDDPSVDVAEHYKAVLNAKKSSETRASADDDQRSQGDLLWMDCAAAIRSTICPSENRTAEAEQVCDPNCSHF